jgi:hypothetical protein
MLPVTQSDSDYAVPDAINQHHLVCHKLSDRFCVRLLLFRFVLGFARLAINQQDFVRGLQQQPQHLFPDHVICWRGQR